MDQPAKVLEVSDSLHTVLGAELLLVCQYGSFLAGDNYSVLHNICN